MINDLLIRILHSSIKTVHWPKGIEKRSLCNVHNRGQSLFNFVREHSVLTWPSSRVGSGFLISGTNLTEFLQKRSDLDPFVKNSGSDRVLNTILVSKHKCFASENLRRNFK